MKIGGNRVELLEIETALAACPGVHRAVVLARPDGRREARLVAYIAPERGPGPSARELRTRLAERLPAFMVPPVFVTLDALPTTPNGKVDHRALPAPVEDRGAAGVAYAAPRTAIEHRLAALWAELLDLERVGIHDEFFALGGDSLLLIRLLGRIQAEFGRRVGLEAIFREVTVEQVARILGEGPPGRSDGRVDPARPAGSKPPLFCLDDYGILLARSLGLDQPVHWLEQDIDYHESITIEELARYREEGLRAIRPEGPQALLGYGAGGVIAFEMAHQLLAQGQDVALVALLDSPDPGPPRVGRIRLQAHRFSRRIRKLMRGDLGERAGRLSSRFQSMTTRITRRIGLAPPSGRRAGDARDVDHADLTYAKYLRAAGRRYSPRPLDCKVALFVARDSDDRWLDERRISTWEAPAASGLELHRVPGDHITFMKGDNLQALAREFLGCLHRAQRG